jgi:uncharacterized membrane protein YphA (DoxX/SURF4 family)
LSSTWPERSSTENPDTRATEDPNRTTALRPFGVSPVSESEWEDPEESRPAKARHIIDRWDGALGLLVLRIVVAAIFAIRGLQKVQHLDVTKTQFEQIGIPYVGVCEVAIAVALIFGIAMRVVGVGIAVIAIGALAYVKWRTGALFTEGQPGFTGELELLLAAVGVMFVGVGGGGWTVDRRFRRR